MDNSNKKCNGSLVLIGQAGLKFIQDFDGVSTVAIFRIGGTHPSQHPGIPNTFERNRFVEIFDCFPVTFHVEQKETVCIKRIIIVKHLQP